jgi:multiple sugar transport system ATP-binding protein
MASVELRQVHKRYDNGHVAVAEASFEIADGELLVLVGPSGCGKSTLLRMIAGLESISAGELRIGGRVVNEMAPKHRDIAMVFQNYALYPHMTVAQNLAFGLQLRKLPATQIEARIAQAAQMLGLGEMLQRLPKELSGGQRQRVALGRALVREPAVFLLDEPLSNLDAKLRAGMRTEIARLHRALGATMVYVTHDQIEAMTLGQRIVVLRDGRIQQIDTPMALYERPANLFVAGFLGSPAMNFLRGDELPGLGAGAEVMLGLRPEHLALGGAGEGRLEATLEAVEPLGNEVFLHLRRSERALVARVVPGAVPEPGAQVVLHFDPARVHRFDAKSEERLS